MGTAAACVILMSFAAGHPKSYWNGCIKGCDSDLSRDFLNFGDGDFSFEIPFKNYFKIVFFLLWRRDPSGFGAAISDAVARRSILLCNSVCADRIVMAASRLMSAAAVCVILMSLCSWTS